MPNWCLNNLTVSHNDNAMMKRFIDAYNSDNLCNEFVPEPKEVQENDDIHDPNCWYNWRINNWGTKWDIGAGDDERHGLKASVVEWNNGSSLEATCSFDSAWSPPVELYNKLVELGYNVHASYFEPGMSFCGIYHNGHDNYIEYKSKDEIPVAIWNEYNLDEFFNSEEEVA